MRVVIEKRSNGIHEYIATTIQDPKVEDIEFVKNILELVEKYNKDQIEKA